MEKLYAKAIDELAHQEGANAKKLAAQLQEHLRETGRTKLLPRILRELKVLEARREKLAPSVEVASEKEAASALAAAKAAGVVATEARVNHSLIRGWRATSGGMLVDRSAKRGLIELYRNVTNQ
jgi:F0F1-type ATP synthase delta subunit